MSNILRCSAFLAYVLALLVTAALPTAAADFSAPGPFAVGWQTLEIPDPTGGKAALTVQAWYPAASPKGVGAPTQIKAEKDAAPATTGPFPLVVVIHGAGGQAMLHATLGKHLASYGFVVLAANYDGADTSEEKALSFFDGVAVHMLYTRPMTVLKVVGLADTLTAPGGPLAGVIDTSQIGVWGHSSGGTTALQAAGAQIDFKEMDSWCDANPAEKGGETCQFVSHVNAVAKLYGAPDPLAAPLPPISDNRVAALVLAAPGGELHAFGDTGVAVVKVPTLTMVSTSDEYVNPGFNALWAYDHIASEDKSLAVFDQGGHMMFVAGTGARFDQAVALTTAFFLDILRDDSSGKAALMPAAVSYVGVTYKTTIQ